ncbi:hypothetical protein Syun_016997 [Stephania yunnanensis]|uniref:Uncharacterized protein n=1 Tax=Stephania yunnanensis TaxID=152371 RepID=A0AAP0P4H9_9MAGN
MAHLSMDHPTDNNFKDSYHKAVINNSERKSSQSSSCDVGNELKSFWYTSHNQSQASHYDYQFRSSSESQPNSYPLSGTMDSSRT